MSILSTILDITRAVNMPDMNDIDKILADADADRVDVGTSYDSIAKQSKNGVMQFPFLSTRALSFDNMQMVAKAGERNFANFLQVVFTMNQVTNDADPTKFIKRFHQNQSGRINGASDVATFIFDSSIPKEVQNKIMRDVSEGNITFEDMFRMESLNDIYQPKDSKVMIAMETSRPGDRRYHEREDPQNNLPKNIFVDSDVKKANELAPTLMQVRIMKQATMNVEAQYIDFIVGVKATIHPIDSADMIDHIVSIFQDRGKLFKLITWTTGEISLFKDLIFNIDAIKGDIKGVRTGKSSTWWTALKNAKAKRKAHIYTLRQPVLPNASLVMSIDEVDYIKANYGFDVLTDESGGKIVKYLNILAFYVVDSSNEILYSYMDGGDHYNINTFRALERDAGNSEKQFKDILKAVNKLQ